MIAGGKMNIKLKAALMTAAYLGIFLVLSLSIYFMILYSPVGAVMFMSLILLSLLGYCAYKINLSILIQMEKDKRGE
jgi:hypothetical protein